MLEFIAIILKLLKALGILYLVGERVLYAPADWPEPREKKIQIPGKCLLARKRLFNHVGSFIGESAQAVESMYKKIRKDEMVIDLLYSCKDVIE